MTGPREGEVLDDLQNGYKILQAKDGFRFGADAVLLADYAVVRPSDRVLDLGCGNGILPILLAARSGSRAITGLEIQKESADLARRSVAYNGLEDRIDIVEGDIREAVSCFGPASFDVIVSNPPYMTAGHGKLNPDPQTAIARHEICCTLEDLTKAAAALLRVGGRLYLVHRPFRLAEILDVLREHRLEPKRMRLVYPFLHSGANLVLIEAVRGGKARLTVEPPLIMYESPGTYTPEVLAIYGMRPEEGRQKEG